jgi:enoyl-CoA hydratase/carnithine racemase
VNRLVYPRTVSVLDFLETSREGRILRIALNRPDKRNALNAQLCRELVRSLEEAFSQPAIGAILLTGNGKHFCAGMDLGEVSMATAAEISNVQEQLFTIGTRANKPIVCAAAGASLGGGMGLVANCHIVVAHPEATFGLTEIRIGLWPFLVFRALTLAIGERRLVELALTGRVVDASEATQMGLVHGVSANPESRAVEIAEAIATFSPTTVRAGMEFANETRALNWASAGRVARRVRDEIFAGADFAEGLRAFHEKRAPQFPSLREVR